MSSYKLTRKAEADLEALVHAEVERFGYDAALHGDIGGPTSRLAAI